MTVQIMVNILAHGYLRNRLYEGLGCANLLILDECHHTAKNDPYVQVRQGDGNTGRTERRVSNAGLTWLAMLTPCSRHAHAMLRAIKKSEGLPLQLFIGW